MPSITATLTSPGLDAHGNPMSGDSAAVALYDRAMDRYLRFHPDIIELAGELVGSEAPTPMALAMVAYLQLSSTNTPDLAAARELHAALESSAANEREQMHSRAIGNWLAGDWIGAGRTLDELLLRWPTDVLALMLGHQLDFFVGDAQNLRDRPLRSLRAFDPEHPHVGFLRGMAAFGLEEAGHYAQALDTGLAAVDANPDDVWAIHAVTHTYEMQGRVDEGIRFLTSGTPRWETGNLFTVHNWWHLGLFHLEAGTTDQALAIYDREIHHASSAGVPMEMLDASALLWRLALDGVDTGSRFDALADSWHATTGAEPWYTFNDLHAVVAFAGAGRLADVRSVIARQAAYIAGTTGAQGTNVPAAAEVGIPACRAILAFAEGRHDDVIAELHPIRRVTSIIGGSHAQRDLLQRTLLESALRSGRFELARGLAAERLGVRESNVYGWLRLAAARRGLGDEAGATDADRTAAEHRSRFLAAV